MIAKKTLKLSLKSLRDFGMSFPEATEDFPWGHSALKVKKKVFVFLWADADAPEWAGPIKLSATGKRGDEVLRREVRPYSRVWQNTDMNSSRPSRRPVFSPPLSCLFPPASSLPCATPTCTTVDSKPTSRR